MKIRERKNSCQIGTEKIQRSNVRHAQMVHKNFAGCAPISRAKSKRKTKNATKTQHLQTKMESFKEICKQEKRVGERKP